MQGALQTLARRGPAAWAAARPLVASGHLRMDAAAFSSNPIEDRGHAEENVRFRKEDERLLRQLLQKVKAQADNVDVHEAEATKSLELSSLKEIVSKYSVSDEDLKKLIAWKHA